MTTAFLLNLITENQGVTQNLQVDQLRFVGLLPEGLSLSAVSLYALQEPEQYCEPFLANRLVFCGWIRTCGMECRRSILRLTGHTYLVQLSAIRKTHDGLEQLWQRL